MTIEMPLAHGPFEAQRALFVALDKAIKATNAVAKSGQNTEQGNYRYAKAEHVVAEADRVLSESGISVAPVRSAIEFKGEAKGKQVFSLTVTFLVAHVDGAWFLGEMTIAIGANLGGSPPQASSSALTGVERDFYRALLRMPRVDADDPDSPQNTRPRREDRDDDDDPRPQPKPQVAVQTARKATLILRSIEEIRTPEQFDKVRDKWNVVLSFRGKPDEDGHVDDCGYSNEEAERIGRALEDAKRRVGL